MYSQPYKEHCRNAQKKHKFPEFEFNKVLLILTHCCIIVMWKEKYIVLFFLQIQI